MLRLSRRDLEAALEFVHLASSVDGDDPFPRPVLDALARLVPCEWVAYYEWELADRIAPIVALEVPVVGVPPAIAEATLHLCATYPLSVLRLSTATEPCRLSDFISTRALHGLEYYSEVLRPLGIEYQVRLWLAAPLGTARVFQLNRRATAGDFDDREWRLLELLRPFLTTLRANAEVRAHACVNAEELTEREAEVLECVARGQTNREIAEALCVSTHTVRKHLENVYSKLGVHTRTAAVARASALSN